MMQEQQLAQYAEFCADARFLQQTVHRLLNASPECVSGCDDLDWFAGWEWIPRRPTRPACGNARDPGASGSRAGEGLHFAGGYLRRLVFHKVVMAPQTAAGAVPQCSGSGSGSGSRAERAVENPAGGRLCNDGDGGMFADCAQTATRPTVPCVSPCNAQSSNAGGDTCVSGDDSDSDQSWPECHGDEFGLPESYQDLAELPSAPGDKFTTFEITVCFNFAYCVPVLYVRQLDNEDKASRSENDVPPIMIDASEMSNAAHTVSLEVHPLLQCPCFMLNPCRTYDVLRTLHSQKSRTATTVECPGLVSWLALQATLFKARVSPKLYLRIAASFQERQFHEKHVAKRT